MDSSGEDNFECQIVFSADVNSMHVEHEGWDSNDWAAAMQDSADEWGDGDEALRREQEALDF